MTDSQKITAFYSSTFDEAERIGAELLKTLGMPMHLEGFAYLKFAVAFKAFNRSASLSKTILPAVSAIFGKSTTNIERSMRYAIEVTWSRGNINSQYKLFGYTISADKGKPVVNECISMLGELVRNRLFVINYPDTNIINENG